MSYEEWVEYAEKTLDQHILSPFHNPPLAVLTDADCKANPARTAQKTSQHTSQSTGRPVDNEAFDQWAEHCSEEADGN